MPLLRLNGTKNVLDMARIRIKNVFDNDAKVYLQFYAGKDSLCLAHLIYSMVLSGEISAKNLVVVFFDEECYYKSMYEMALRWRKRFIKIGAEFRWYCLPFKQVCGFEHLQDEESWITFEPGKEDVWIHQPPPFAIRTDPYLHYAGEMNYQKFSDIRFRDGIKIVGVRAVESVQRIKYLATIDMASNKLNSKNTIYPIYDWKDSDVWLYIKENDLDFPEAYMDLFRAGATKKAMRLSQLFATDSCNGLRYIAQTDNEMWERILAREPNAYLVMLYWDSEMFKRSTRKRKELESEQQKKDYAALVREMLFVRPDDFFTNEATKKVAYQYREFILKSDYMISDKVYRRMYEALMAGDPKLRTLRALYTESYVEYLEEFK